MPFSFFFFFSGNKTLLGVVIGLSCLVFILVIVIVWLFWRLRRSVPKKCDKLDSINSAKVDSQFEKRRIRHNGQESEPSSYMELIPRPGHGKQTAAAAEYESLQYANRSPAYRNLGFKSKEEDQIYENVEIPQA